MEPIGMPGQGGPTSEIYRFDDIVVDTAAHTVLRAGQPQTIEPKAFAVLLVLLRRHGELVPRDELLDAVWGHRHVTPGVLTRVIAQLRHVLGDDSQHPRYIQTQHALGYRFIGLPRRDSDYPNSSEASATSVNADDEAVGETVVAVRQSVPASLKLAANEPVPPDGGREAVEDGARQLRSRASAWGLVVALGLLVALGAWWYTHQRPERPAEASIAVLPFNSLSDNKGDGYFADGLAVEMHDALAGVPGLKVIAAPTAGGGLKAKDAKALGAELGVATLLDASVRREGARVRINARLTDTNTGYTLWTHSYDRETSDVFAMQSEIANEVVQALLGVLPTGEGKDLARRLAPTTSVAAYDAYLKGRQELQERGDKADADSAINYFRGALAIDPGFARAQAGICRAEITRFEGVRDVAAFDRAQAACKRAEAMDPSLRETSLALGELHRIRGEASQAIEHYTRALEDPALRADAYIGLAQLSSAQGRNVLALDYFERARKLRPRDALIYRERGYHYYTSGDVPAAIESYKVATSLQPDDYRLWSGLGGLYLANGDSAQASAAFERSLQIRPNYSALSNLGTVKYDSGAYAEAADLYRHAVELDPSDFRLWGNIGDALAASSVDKEEAREYYRRAAQLAERYVQIRPDDAQGFAQLGWYRANLDEKDKALAMQGKAEALATERGEVAFWGAQTMAVLGDEASAREYLEKAFAEGIPTKRVGNTPVLRRLEGEVAAVSGPAPASKQ
ncbi:tetratricopeptide repeat protein [Lysobacter niastensis]|uniref:Winged helix-turn-helix domain-containing protein n=1 Tax=Lysobacter niastensis TaxID=380629 RepID=A0ABS0B350_9GAMM|nr:tetratricopeptide repeat protein [Lysobacter niastensis]MBF6022906.1 winged helix-turn-helix domain-containing protein [Lysobacter niastensis]